MASILKVLRLPSGSCFGSCPECGKPPNGFLWEYHFKDGSIKIFCFLCAIEFFAPRVKDLDFLFGEGTPQDVGKVENEG